MFEKPRIGQELLDVPMGDMIQQMAFAIAEAQRRLDENSIDTAQMMGGLETITDEVTGEVTFQDSRVFFGKEKVTITDAITLHNQSSDMGFRQTIRESLQSAGIGITETNVVNVGTLTAPILFLTGATTPNLETADNDDYSATPLNDPAKIYLIPGAASNPDKYYKLLSDISDTERKYQEVNRYSTTIATENALVGGTIYVPSRVSMLELGFSPTFYQFVDTIIEVKISIKYTQEGSVTRNSSAGSFSSSGRTQGLRGLIFGGRRSSTVTTAHVNATYSQKFSYSAEGSSLLRTKLVPIPPPAILEERIRAQMEVLRDASLPPATT
jgi:hypothetical protein